MAREGASGIHRVQYARPLKVVHDNFGVGRKRLKVLHLRASRASSDLVTGGPMPSRHVLGVGSQLGAGFVEGIVKLQIEVMRLQVDRRNHRGHRAGEFAEAIENVLRL